METLIRTTGKGQKAVSECMKALFAQDYLDDMCSNRRAPFRGVKVPAGAPAIDINPLDSYVRQRFILYVCASTRQNVSKVTHCITTYFYKRKEFMGFQRVTKILRDKGYGNIVTGVSVVRKILRHLKLTPVMGNCIAKTVAALENGTHLPPGARAPARAPPGANNDDDDDDDDDEEYVPDVDG